MLVGDGDVDGDGVRKEDEKRQEVGSNSEEYLRVARNYSHCGHWASIFRCSDVQMDRWIG